VLRVDRTELSKNIVRGLEAFRELLRDPPQWRERVVHLALAYPSRHELPEYREYTAAVQRVAREINDEYGTPAGMPVHLEVKDDYARSLAAYRLADVLVVNPLRDGMNLVAKEGPVVSERGVALVLSREAGAATSSAQTPCWSTLRRGADGPGAARRAVHGARGAVGPQRALPRRRRAAPRRPGCARSWTRSLPSPREPAARAPGCPGMDGRVVSPPSVGAALAVARDPGALDRRPGAGPDCTLTTGEQVTGLSIAEPGAGDGGSTEPALRHPVALTCSAPRPEELRARGSGRPDAARRAAADRDRAVFGRQSLGGFAPGGVRSGHVEGSAHYEGRAIDVFFRPGDARGHGARVAAGALAGRARAASSTSPSSSSTGRSGRPQVRAGLAALRAPERRHRQPRARAPGPRARRRGALRSLTAP
jgi:hypothetical protein